MGNSRKTVWPEYSPGSDCFDRSSDGFCLGNLISAADFSPRSIRAPLGWVGHVPLAAWIIKERHPRNFVELGMHTGNSYFTFCQSVQEASLVTKCFAVDTWHGDEHTGQYGDEVFQQVNGHHQQHYSGFSKLLRMTFDEAVHDFADESVDMLHIDGFHTYDAVKHDFETWLPKLAAGAIVMFHDVSVRERNFGVWKFWRELQETYSSNLEFDHSNGLGLLQLNGHSGSGPLEWLRPDSRDRNFIKKYFTVLGVRQLERCELVAMRQALAERSTYIGSHDHGGKIQAMQNICAIFNEVALPGSEELKRAVNSTWYLQHNPDIARAGVDPYEHWRAHGKNEGRVPADDLVGLIRKLIAERVCPGARTTLGENDGD